MLLPALAVAETLDIGVFSFDNLIPDGDTAGVNVFDIANFTGATWSLPPDFPVADDLTLQDAVLTLEGDVGEQQISLGDIAPGIFDPSSTAEFVDTENFTSAILTATLSETNILLYDGSTFNANSATVTAAITPSLGSDLTAGVDYALITATSNEAATPEPSTAATLAGGLLLLIVAFTTRRWKGLSYAGRRLAPRHRASDRRLITLMVAICCPTILLTGQPTPVTLSPAASPTAGQPGITVINLTGSGFPTGTIQPTAITVSLQPTAGGTAVTTLSSAVTTIAGTTRRVTFTIPPSISVQTPAPYAVSISGVTTTNATFSSTNTAALTINPAAQILSAVPATGKPGQTLSVTLTGAYTNFVQGSTVASFGAGIAVGGAAEGALGPITVSGPTTAVAQLVIDPAASTGTRNVTVSTGAQTATLVTGFSVSNSPPTITSFAPQSGTVGTIVTINGTNFGSAPQVTMPGVNGYPISIPLQSMTATSVSVVIPSGAVTGSLTVSNSGASASTASAFTVNAANTFSLAASPATATLIQGQSVSYTVQLTSTNGFSQLAQLSATGLPTGITASFKPSSITVGQTSVLTLNAPANQAVSTTNISISAAATVSGISQTQTVQTSLAVTGPTTTLLGRTVVTDSLETPIAGVIVTSLGQDGNGNTTACTGQSTVSDAAGNFMLANLPMQCTGPQLFQFNGNTAIAPPGKYAGVNLIFNLVAGQVTASPILVHLPRIDNAETFFVTQNSSSVQTHAFTSIPGLVATVYPGTTLTMPDGTQPNPFPLVAVQVPVDRLADVKPNVPTMMRVFLASFQPEGASASQPVAVSFPNVGNTPIGTDMVLMTLDPTHGTMVPYGTGAVSADGTQVVPDPDPANPGHLYGLVHMDWFAPMPPPPDQPNPCPQCPAPTSGDPVDLSSGLQVLGATDLSVSGGRGSISVQRSYRAMTTVDGPFGPGTQTQYGWQLNTNAPNTAAAINLISPAGNTFLFSRQANGTLTNSTIPSLQGVVMTTNSSNSTSLRYSDGTVYQFLPAPFSINSFSYLGSITDRNSNTTTLTSTIIDTPNGYTERITTIADPVGRSINLTYDSNGHVTQAVDPIGRAVAYTYNASGTLATVTNPAGGVTSYQYDSQNRVTSMTDPRGVVMFQDTFDVDGRVSQQVQPDGGVIQFAYTLGNPLAATSPVIATTVTDPLGNQTTYRFNTQGFPTDVTDALGQTKSFARDPMTNEVLQVTGPAQCAICGGAGQGPVNYTYDSQGNRLTSTDALGNTTSYTYDPVFNQVTSITDPLNHTRTFAYDGSGNLTSVTDENGNTSTFSYDPTGLLLQGTDPLGNKTSIAYDSFADPATVTDPLGNVTKTVFDGISRPSYTTDALGRTTTNGFDALNRLISFRDGRNNITVFAYDPVGNLLSLTDPRGNATTFSYDAFSRMMTRTSALGKSDSYQYDLAGNLVQYTDRRDQVSHFQYDALNRLVNESYQDGATVSRTYDPYSRLLTVDDSVGGLFTFGYDLNGRLVSQGEPTGTVNYTRDQLQRVATRQVVGQSAVTYSYDPAGNLLGASIQGAGITYAYDARNLPRTESRTNGVVSSYAFDPLGRVLSLIHSNGAIALNTQSYTYDSVGNRSSANNDISQPLITQAASASVDAANELLTDGSTTYTSDANGNRLTETSPAGTVFYQWDGRNRLSSITDASGNVTSFKYDFARNLQEIDRTVAGSIGAQKFLIDNLTNIASLTDASGLPVSVLTGRSIDSHYASVDSSGNVAFGIGDTLGSTDAVTNVAGTVASKLDYEPYGQTTGATSIAYPFAYTGRILVFGNVYYYRNRFYDASVGRFLSEDPAGILGSGYNLTEYVNNRTVLAADPRGLGILSPNDWYDLAGQELQNAYDQIIDADKEAAQDAVGNYLKNLGNDAACAFGNPGIANVVDAAVNGFGLGADVFGASEAFGAVFEAIAVSNPIGLGIGLVGFGFSLYDLVKDEAEVAQTVQRGANGSSGACSCGPR